MRVMVVFESMYGNTHTVADRIAAGFGAGFDVRVVPVGEAPVAPQEFDLLVVGGPTHLHNMTTGRSREAAVKAADDDASLHVEEFALDGLRDWFGSLAPGAGRPAAAFDTRVDGKPLLTGRASKGIAKRLRHDGYELLVEPESFLVDHDRLLDGEADRAQAWGAALAAAVLAATPVGDPADG
jgi:Flavodoxin